MSSLDENETQPTSRQLLEEAVALGASDIHIDPHSSAYAIRFHIDGALIDSRRLKRSDGILLINQLKAEIGIDPGTNFIPRASRETLHLGKREIDIRVTIAPCISGEKVAVRLLDPQRVELLVDDLGMGVPDATRVRDWLETLNGMFIVSGPTSSGKTTTLYALLHELAKLDRHVLTIEDPVEYEIDGINQIQVDHHHDLDFASGLKAMLRLDPDVMMLGEMRERSAVEVAARAATSGHILLSTIHARDAVSTITALRNFGMGGNQIAVTIAVIVNQRLVRKLCSDCREKRDPSREEIEWLHARGLKEAAVWGASGCETCRGLGYAGRSGIFETWRLDDRDYELLLSNADEKSIRKKRREAGEQSLVDDGWKRVRAGITSLAEFRHATGGLRAGD